MTQIGIAEVDIRAEMAQFDLQIKASAVKFDQFAKGIQRDSLKIDRGMAELNSSAKRMTAGLDGARRMASGFLSVLASGALVQQVKSTLDWADNLTTAADSMGILSEEYQRLSYAASQSNIDNEEFRRGMEKFTKNIASQAKAFEEFDIDLKNSRGTFRAVEEVLGDVADRFQEFDDQAMKAKLSMDLFGKSGINFSLLLGEGSEGLREMKEEAERLHLVLSDDLLRSGASAADAVDRLTLSMGVMAKGIALSLAPQIDSLANKTLEYANAMEEMRKQASQPGTLANFAGKSWNVVSNLAYTGTELYGAIMAEYENMLLKDNNKAYSDAIWNGMWDNMYDAWFGIDKQIRNEISVFRKQQDQMMKDFIPFPEPSPRSNNLHMSAIEKSGSVSKKEFAGLDYDDFFKPLLRDLEKERIDSLVKYDDLLGPVIRDLEQQRGEWKAIAEGINAAYDETFQLTKTQDELNLLLDEGLIGSTVYMRAWNEATKQQIELQNQLLMADETFGSGALVAKRDYFQEIGNDAKNMYDLVSDAFRGMEDVFVETFTTGRLEMDDFMRAMQSDLARIFYRKSIGSFLETGINTLFGGARAEGGPVSIGRTYLVGERGPELFSPERSGYIHPNALNVGGGNRTVNVERGAITVNMPSMGNGRPTEMVYSANQAARRMVAALANLR